jgi:hypothetical protein
MFVRNREQLANPPVSLEIDATTVDLLAEQITAWALAGLAKAV